MTDFLECIKSLLEIKESVKYGLEIERDDTTTLFVQVKDKNSFCTFEFNKEGKFIRTYITKDHK